MLSFSVPAFVLPSCLLGGKDGSFNERFIYIHGFSDPFCLQYVSRNGFIGVGSGSDAQIFQGEGQTHVVPR